MSHNRYRGLTPALEQRLSMLREWSGLLDTAYRVPGTGIRFGWDPILGVIPGLGDLVGPLFSAVVLWTAVQLGIPRIVLVRMLLIAVIDVAIGIIPVVGDAFDVFWKASRRNLQLLERHAAGPVEPRLSDWIFVTAVLGSLAVAAAVPFVLLAALVRWLGFPLV
jgi:hypothetical protein